MMAIVMSNLEKKPQQKAAPVVAKPAAAAPAKPAEAAPVSTGLKSEGIFGMMATYLNQGLGKDLIPKV